jgi:hypothetical protein
MKQTNKQNKQFLLEDTKISLTWNKNISSRIELIDTCAQNKVWIRCSVNYNNSWIMYLHRCVSSQILTVFECTIEDVTDYKHYFLESFFSLEYILSFFLSFQEIKERKNVFKMTVCWLVAMVTGCDKSWLWYLFTVKLAPWRGMLPLVSHRAGGMLYTVWQTFFHDVKIFIVLIV